jgi:hypothetical protein
VKETNYRFILVKKNFYTGFTLENDIFIALPEKALADAVYLSSLNKYNCDFNALDFSKINKSEITKYIKKTNKKTINFWDAICKRYRI